MDTFSASSTLSRNFCRSAIFYVFVLTKAWSSQTCQYYRINIKILVVFADLGIHQGIIWEADLQSNYVKSTICWFSLGGATERELSGSLSEFLACMLSSWCFAACDNTSISSFTLGNMYKCLGAFSFLTFLCTHFHIDLQGERASESKQAGAKIRGQELSPGLSGRWDEPKSSSHYHLLSSRVCTSRNPE